MLGARFTLLGSGSADGSQIGARFSLGGGGAQADGLPRFVLGGGRRDEEGRSDLTSHEESLPYHIQVTRIAGKSVSFYVSLCKRALLVNETLELSGIGEAMATTVNISEVLENSGVAKRIRVCTSMVTFQEAPAAAPKSAEGFGSLSLGSKPGKLVSRPKIQIWMAAVNTPDDRS